MTIDWAFYGFPRLRVGVGRDDDVQWVNVACFGNMPPLPDKPIPSPPVLYSCRPRPLNRAAPRTRQRP
jgi:hypothetical protein